MFERYTLIPVFRLGALRQRPQQQSARKRPPRRARAVRRVRAVRYMVQVRFWFGFGSGSSSASSLVRVRSGFGIEYKGCRSGSQSVGMPYYSKPRNFRPRSQHWYREPVHRPAPPPTEYLTPVCPQCRVPLVATIVYEHPTTGAAAAPHGSA